MAGLAPGPWMGHYQIIRPLARGGMGEVWLAHDQRLHRYVVVKVVRRELDVADAHRRFMREVRSVAGIEHRNVARLFDAGVDDEGTAYFTMEYVEGVPLTKVILAVQSAGGLSIPGVAAIGKQACDALAALHEPPASSGRSPLVHRDISPQNLLLEADGTLKLLDLGIARGEGLTALTRAGAMLGKPAYMSPEQGRGLEVGPASDLYALGVVLFELATGRWFRSRLPRQALAQIGDAAFTARRIETADMPDGLRSLIGALLAEDPRARPRTAREVAGRLEALVPGSNSIAGMRALSGGLRDHLAEALAAVEAQRVEDEEALLTATPTLGPAPEAVRAMAPPLVASMPGPNDPSMPTSPDGELSRGLRAKRDPRLWLAVAGAVASVAFYAGVTRSREEVSEVRPMAAPAPVEAPRPVVEARPLVPSPVAEPEVSPAAPARPPPARGTEARPLRARPQPAAAEGAEAVPASPPPREAAAPTHFERAQSELRSGDRARAAAELRAHAKTLGAADRRAVLTCLEDATFLSVERPRIEPCMARAAKVKP